VHEVWYREEEDAAQNGDTEERVILLFDVWHPELTPLERSAIQDMFKGIKKG
jgi:hypothetical protein